MERKITISGEEVYLHKAEYQGGRIALHATDMNGMPFAKLTVNLPEVDIGENEAFIKSHDESAGYLESLIQQGVVSEPIMYAQSGYVQFPLVKVLI